MKKDSVIKFQAQVIKVQSMSDGALRVTLDMPEHLTDIAMLLMESKRQGGLLEVAAIPVKAKSGRKSRKTEITDDSSATY